MPTCRILFAALLALAGGRADARSVTLAVERLQAAQAQAEAVRLVVDERGADGTLRLEAARIAVPALALAGRLEWTCTLARDDDGARRCAGPVRLGGDDGAQDAALQARVGRDQVEFELVKDTSRVRLTLPFGPAPLGLALQRVPAAWLRAPLVQAWPNGDLRDGTFDVEARWRPDGRLDAHYAADGLDLATRDGAFAATALGAHGQVGWNPAPDGARLVADAELHGGSLQLGTLAVALPDAPVAASLDARARGDGRWQVARFAWNDADALVFEAAAEIEPSALDALRSLDVKLASARLPQAAERYAKPLLAAQGLAGLAMHGELAGEFAVDAGGVQRIALATEALDVADRARGLRIDGVRGGLDWAPHGERPATTLAWRRARIGELAASAASARWQARDGALHLLGTLALPLGGGRVSLRQTVLDPRARDGDLLRSAFALQDLGYDSADGTLAAAQLAADGTLRLGGRVDAPRVRVAATFHGGEALAGPVYLKLPATPVTASLDATLEPGRWRVDALDWNDPGTLELHADGVVAPADQRPLQALQLDLRQARLDAALARYAQSWLATKGYGELAASGSLSGSLQFDASGLQRFAVLARDVGVRDGGGRFAVSGVDGGVAWDFAGEAPASTLGWNAAELFGVPLGSARATLASQRRAITLAQPLAIDVLGGQVKLEQLSMLPRSPRGERYAASFALAGIEMAQLSRVLGWPRFPGNLSGGIPEVVFAGDVIELRGGLDLYVFDGHLGVSGVRLERPFGVAPSLAADVHFENLDLQQLTGAFSFGGMSGRLFGTIDQLRLVDWSPVAFDAWLRTRCGGRMSYKAVDDISALGGGGLSANLQTLALQWFDTFGYARLGIRCRLRDEVCLMGGIDPLPPDVGSSAAGYTIVEGAGIPRISIIGHRRRVDWPTLVRRLREATQGQGPVIQ
jgi:hypothetical protein